MNKRQDLKLILRIKLNSNQKVPKKLSYWNKDKLRKISKVA